MRAVWSGLPAPAEGRSFGAGPVCLGETTGKEEAMNADKSNVTFDTKTRSSADPATLRTGRNEHVWPWVNWGVALSTVPAAAIVMLFALGAVMSTDGCAAHSCQTLGHGGIDFGVAFYGAPLVAFVVIVISFFTAKRRKGIVVPLFGWVLLVADVAVMAISVAN